MELRLEPKQSAAFQTIATELLYGGAKGGGKAGHVDELIPTPSGWTTFGKVAIGDEVLGVDGKPTRVVAMTPVMRNPCTRLTFSDGTDILVDDGHLWKTRTADSRVTQLRRDPLWKLKRRENRASRGTGKRPELAAANSARARMQQCLAPQGPELHTTAQIAQTLRVHGVTNHSIDNPQALQLPQAELSIEPYTLGAWLGDGCTTTGSISGLDNVVFEQVAADGFTVTHRANPTSRGVLGLITKLRAAGLQGNKHIPAQYLRASFSQRMALLQGLMDTDGWCEKDGSCKIALTRKELFDGVVELIRTFGITVNITTGLKSATNGSPGNVSRCWTACFVTEFAVFRLQRKQERQNRKPHARYSRRFIVDAQPAGIHEVRCIQVENADGMFLAGRQMIPTHNSYLLRVSAIRWALEVPGIQVYLFRRKLPDLRRNHLQGPTSFFRMLGEHLKAGLVKYRAVENEFEFENGSCIHLCYCDAEGDVENYQGAEIHVLMPDELTHYTDYQYRYLRAQVRLSGVEIPEKYKGKLPRVEAGSNPGSVGHAWVRRAFISPKPAHEIWRAPKDEGGMLRQFIPAKLVDNPHLTKDDPEYAARLQGMGSDNLVRAMLEGDWDIIAGAAFEKLRRDLHCVEPFEPPDDWMVFGSLDWGSSRPFSFGLWAVSNGNALPDGRVYRRGAIIRYKEWYGWNGKANEGKRLEVEDVAQGIKQRCGSRKLAYIAADPSIWKVDGGPSHAERMLRFGVVLRKADNSREPGYVEVRQRIAGDEEGPMLYATKNCHEGFWRTMPDLVMDDDHVEDVDTDNEDHAYDDVRYACMSRPWMQAPRKKKEAPDRWMRRFEEDAQAEESWRTA